MSTTTPISTPASRILSVDALRGFALLGIMIVHMIEQYLAAGPPKEYSNYAAQHDVDHVFMAISGIFLQGKFFAIFSFLFGLSFFLQMDASARRGEPFIGKFVWRLVLLFVIGFIHSLFYRGDILSIYAMVGLGLILFYRASNRTLLIVAGIFIGGIPRLLLWGVRYALDIPPIEWESFEPQNAWYYDTVKNGSLLEVFAANATVGFKMKLFFQFDTVSRGYITFGLFLLGIWVGRTRFFERLHENRRLLIRLVWQSFLAIVALGLVLALMFSQIKDYNSLPAMIGMSLGDIGNCLIALFEVSLFLLLCLGKWGNGVISALAPYGKMALTNYVMQSLIGTFIFFGWGLGQIGAWGASINFGLAILLYILQVQFSKWWLKHYQYGPLEWLWRSGTQRRWANLRRESVVGLG
ncbi:DUF418 domain-containing protein [Haliscomenobacter hydrossis]|uniref:DUF418 domain-containing protein n=1 Tax=Haliscomenobacter hydrossis (strain ATCC 27775 / DSM 1100 / LMG 10767 / O) TaxID=760192 RepID=F4KUP6_HALH1|nr:DUF418 domain-containing protein [Haliscomenobacter hydrossis]AEE53449.1 protein of unknown function DUF418 [Haliscomenobacter hydrossis DSM 1100]